MAVDEYIAFPVFREDDSFMSVGGCKSVNQ